MNEAEFRQAYRQHKDMLYRFARRLAGSPEAAEDLVQDCFLMLWREAVIHDPSRGSLRSLLAGVIRNLAWKRLRLERVSSELEESSAVCEPIDPAGLERGAMVERAVAALPTLQREALILAEYEEFTLEEIGRATGAELAAVKSRLHRARTNLKRTLAPLLERSGTPCGTSR